MTTIRLRNHFASDVTMISNEFIDNYMVSANGEYVKIYLYILRLTLDLSQSWTLSTITDKLECTSKDVLRALRYWMRQGLLTCDFSPEGSLTGVTFLDPEDPKPSDMKGKHAGTHGQVTAGTEVQGQNGVPGSVEALGSAGTQISAGVQAPNQAASMAAEYPAQGLPANAPMNVAALPYEKERREPISLDADRLSRLSASTDAKMILVSAEGYLGHTLNKTEIDTLLYFYDELHFSAELLDYLIEYCASKDARRISYIKTVGFAWYDAGITTVEQAKAESRTHNRDYFAIMKAYGLGNREPATSEQEFLKRWLEAEQIPVELVLEAANRTMLQIHAPKFEYTDSILENWRKAGVTTLAQVQELDAQHTQKQQEKKASRRSSSRKTSASKSNSGFSSYEGRTSIDYDSLEKQLLGY